MLKVGITGGIGSGKSTVCKIFEVLGVSVYNADEAAKNLINSDRHIKEAIVGVFGVEAYQNGLYNVDFIKSNVFGNAEKLKALNAIVHPAVKSHYEKWLLDQQSHPYCLKEAAIMTKESGLDKVIYVRASEEIRLQRILDRDSTRDQEEIESIMENQKSDSEFESLSDFIIENENQLLIPQVLKIHQALLGCSIS